MIPYAVRAGMESLHAGAGSAAVSVRRERDGAVMGLLTHGKRVSGAGPVLMIAISTPRAQL
ncbi:hypothetical protein WK95_09445 [Burkholderia ubonensis]|nr:hypothetical protein WK95_09445 [Burkholderia ubonensis]